MAHRESVPRRSASQITAGPWAPVLLIAAISAPATGMAASIETHVRSADGPVANAVVHATPIDGTSLPRPEQPEAVMDQRGRKFTPHVLPVLAGTSIRFPNSDETRHQVYSFSDAKTFELQLYGGETARPITFGQPGLATLGCNIHDWMLGYIYVLDTPAFARTDSNGHARIGALPAGQYRAELWHPRLVEESVPAARTVTLEDQDTATLGYEIGLRPAPDRGQRGFGGQDEESLQDAYKR